MRVTVADVNEPPEFSVETASRTIAENTTTGVAIGAPVTATDPDTGDTPAYTLGGTDAAFFDIDASTGQLQTQAALDHETKSSYTVTVAASDGALTATVDVTVTVTNIDEAGTVALSTDQPAARAEITAALTDPDEGVTGAVWQWERSGDGNTGWAGIGTSSPSYTPVDGDVGYHLRATASYTDGHGPGKTAQAASTQAVQAGANRPPEFDSATAAREVPENTEAGGNIGDSGNGHRPGHRRHPGLHTWRDGCCLLRHRCIDRPVADQSRPGPRDQVQLHSDRGGFRRRTHRCRGRDGHYYQH